MSFKKMVGAVLCGMVIWDAIASCVKIGAKALDKHHQRTTRNDADCEGYESIYSGKKGDGPCARKIGFGAND